MNRCTRWIQLISFTLIQIISRSLADETPPSPDSPVTAAHPNSVCISGACGRLSTFLKQSIDKTADPCDNFYKFACGNYKPGSFNLTDFANIYSGLVQLDVPVIFDLVKSTLLAVEARDPSIPKALKYAKFYYQQCRRWKPTDDSNLSDVLIYLKNYAFWPLFNPTWTKDDFNPFQIAGQLQSDFNLEAFVAIEVIEDNVEEEPRHSYMMRDIDLVSGHALDSVLFPQQKQKYQMLVREYFERINLYDDSLLWSVEDLNRMAKDVVAFELSIIKQILKTRRRLLKTEPLNRPKPVEMTLDELNEALNSSNLWSFYVVTAFAHNTKALRSILSHKISVNNLDNLKWLTNKLKDSKPDAVANFLMWKLIQRLQPFLEEGYQDEHVCLTRTLEYFAYAVPLLIERIPKPELRPFQMNDQNQLIRDVQNSAEAMIVENRLLRSGTVRLISALRQPTKTPSYPSWVHNRSLVDRYFSRHKMLRNQSYFLNSLTVMRWDAKVSEALLASSASGWLFYDPLIPDFFKFAAVGSAIGQKIFQRLPTVHELSLPDQASLDTLRNLSNCYVREYNDYCYMMKTEDELIFPPDEAAEGSASAEQQRAPMMSLAKQEKKLCINGLNSLPGNIDASAGLKAALLAYNSKAVSFETTDFENFDSKQLFFLSYAIGKCKPTTAGEVASQILSGEAPAEAQVNAVLANLPDFSQAFHCRPDNKLRKDGDICELY